MRAILIRRHSDIGSPLDRWAREAREYKLTPTIKKDTKIVYIQLKGGSVS